MNINIISWFYSREELFRQPTDFVFVRFVGHNLKFSDARHVFNC
jgi:hypothetical protein